jgi:uncharacterized protein
MADLIKNTINRQKRELKQYINLQLCRRNQQDKLQSSLKSPLVKAILGPRRSGKSTLVQMAMVGHPFAYVNFEDEGISADVQGDALMATLEEVYPNSRYYFFDEIQNMKGWEQFIHRLHREGKNCIISGSNAHLLSSELASALTGRHIPIQLLPFSFKEITRSKERLGTISFLEYLKKGGFPQVVLSQVDPMEYLRTLWDSIVLKDVVRRYHVRNIASLNEIYDVLINSVAAKFNYDSLSKSVGGRVSPPTVKNYLRFANEAYLFCELSAFHFSTRLRNKSDRKIYLFDNGFVVAKRVQISEDKGRLLENAVFCELVRRGARPNIDLFYFQTSRGHEIDFLWRSAESGVHLFQVSWVLSAPKTKERELRAIRDAAKEFSINRATIITFAESEQLTVDGVEVSVVPAEEWLLNI